MHARLRGPKLLTLYQIINKTRFPSLADEIAEPRPDMNIKVAAFTVSEKSINTNGMRARSDRKVKIKLQPYLAASNVLLKCDSVVMR